MTPPALLFSRFLTACLLGVGLGLIYDFLTALPRKCIHLADGVFVLMLFAFGIYLGFGVCDGDLRPTYSIGLFAGAAIWHFSVGKRLQFLFSSFFRLIGRLFSCFWMPFKKIFAIICLFSKKTFAYIKKWSTIKGRLSLKKRGKGGGKNGTEKTPPDPCSL